MNVIGLAHQILDMQDEIVRLNREVTRLMRIEEDYNRLVAETTEHGEKMMVGWLDLFLNDRVTIKRDAVGQEAS